MSRQNTKIQRWLRGSVDESDATSDPGTVTDPPSASSPRTAESGPAPLSPLSPLPRRSRDSERAKVQGLALDAAELRRRQVGPPTARHRSTVPPAAPATLEVLRGAMEDVLARIEHGLDSFVHAVVGLPNGAECAARGLDRASAAALAMATSQIGEGIGVSSELIDVMALTLTTGDTVVCARTGSEAFPAILRVTLSGASLGLALHQVQQAARDISQVVSTLDTHA